MLGEAQITHWEGCWREVRHHGCAIKKILEQEKEIERLRQALTQDLEEEESNRPV